MYTKVSTLSKGHCGCRVVAPSQGEIILSQKYTDRAFLCQFLVQYSVGFHTFEFGGLGPACRAVAVPRPVALADSNAQHALCVSSARGCFHRTMYVLQVIEDFENSYCIIALNCISKDLRENC